MVQLTLGARARIAIDRLHESIVARARYAEPKMVAVGIFAFFGFPLYYVVWKIWFPQPYESLALRLVFSLVALPLLLVRFWPAGLRRWLPLYWFSGITLSLPFFFTYMLLMNQFSTAWLMSHLGAIYIVLMIFDLRAGLIMLLIGTALAAFAFSLHPHAAVPIMAIEETLPLWVFVLFAGGLFNVSSNIEYESRVASLNATAATIAHELRTPLAAIRLAALGSLTYVDAIVDGYEKARAAGLDVRPVRKSAIRAVASGSEIIQTEVNHALVTIEMLLAAARPAGKQQLHALSARAVVAEAVERYPYASPVERAKVSVSLEHEFAFIGAQALILNVLFNLIKNAIHHTSRAGRGDIRLSLLGDADYGCIIVHDSGPGIPPRLLPRIFHRFVSSAEGSEVGLGIGLAFCKDAVQRVGGTIQCRSELGAYTEFTLRFPLVDAPAIASIDAADGAAP